MTYEKCERCGDIARTRLCVISSVCDCGHEWGTIVDAPGPFSLSVEARNATAPSVWYVSPIWMIGLMLGLVANAFLVIARNVNAGYARARARHVRNGLHDRGHREHRGFTGRHCTRWYHVLSR